MVVIVLTEEDNELGQPILPLPRPVCVGQYNFIWKRKFIAFSAELGQQSFRQAGSFTLRYAHRQASAVCCLFANACVGHPSSIFGKLSKSNKPSWARKV